MRHTLMYLEAVRDRIAQLENKPSSEVTPYQIAKHLHLTPQGVYQLFEMRAFSDDTALSVAEMLGAPILEVIAAANADRAKSPELRERWESIRRSARALK
jgi:inosine/xanthosine triphosphate pyrophosphatase family protein